MTCLSIADLLAAKYPALLTFSELAEIMSLHPQTIRLMYRKGRLPVPVVTFASDKRVLLTDVIAYLEKQREASLNGAPKKRGPKVGSRRQKPQLAPIASMEVSNEQAALQ